MPATTKSDKRSLQSLVALLLTHRDAAGGEAPPPHPPGAAYLHGAVEEAAVLARRVEQPLGGRQRQHAPRLVRLPQAAARLPQELHPRHAHAALWARKLRVGCAWETVLARVLAARVH